MAAVRLTPALRFWWFVHRWLYRLSGGRIGTKVNGFDILLLTTRGRSSGEPRRVALQSLEHGDGWAVIASFAGEDRHPNWWRNLLAEPMATAQIGRRSTGVRAREAIGAERAALWDRFVAVDDAYAEYEQRTSRAIPVVVLEPQAVGDPARDSERSVAGAGTDDSASSSLAR
jgi:deazaflavin-dependent oxidoreductase (nitroreductase family)